MKYLTPKDYKRRKLFVLLNKKRWILKAVRTNSFLPTAIRNAANTSLMNMRKYGMSTKIRNRCILTGRARSISRIFRLGRSKFHELAGKGRLPGVRKSSW